MDGCVNSQPSFFWVVVNLRYSEIVITSIMVIYYNSGYNKIVSLYIIRGDVD